MPGGGCGGGAVPGGCNPFAMGGGCGAPFPWGGGGMVGCGAPGMVAPAIPAVPAADRDGDGRHDQRKTPGPWRSSTNEHNCCDAPEIRQDAVLEIATYSYLGGPPDGSALIQITSVGGSDQHGRAARARSLGASTPAHAINLDMSLGDGSNPQSVMVHFCRFAVDHCSLHQFGYQAIHVDTWRLRHAEDIREPWARAPVVPAKTRASADHDDSGIKVAAMESDLEKLDLLRANLLLKEKIKKQKLGAAGELARAVDKFNNRRGKDGEDLLEDDNDEAVFREASSLAGAGTEKESTGSRWSRGYQQMTRFLGASGGASSSNPGKGSAVTYLNSVFLGANPPSKIGPRNVSELKMLAETIDALNSGDLAHLGDLLMSRLQSVETSILDGDWETAQHLDLSAQGRVTLASVEDRMKAARKSLLHLKLENARGRGQKRGRSPDR